MKGKFFRRNFVGLSKVIPMLVVVALIIAPLFSSVSASEPVTQGSLAVSGFLNRLAKSQAPSAAQSVDSMEVVASGLDNPRGLSFGPDGALYVAEAGRGGNGACLDTPEGLACLGLSGAVTRIFNGVQERVVTNLPSLADPDGFGANGLVSLVVSGKALDLLIGAGFSPEKRSLLGADGQGLGHAARFTNGKVFYGPDFLTYEALHNPDNGAVDSNAYGMAIVQPGVRAVADAGANDVLLVGVTGRMATLAVFPDRLVDAPPFLGLPPGAQIPMQSVPTTVVRGPDGAFYVGELTGFPFPVGGANVYRVVPGSQPTIFASGFTNIVSLAFGPDGSLYVLEIAANGLLSGNPTGALIKVAPDGVRTTLASAGLVMPGGVAVGLDGALYVTNFSVMPGIGQVVRIVDTTASASLASDSLLPTWDFATYLPLIKR